MENFILLNLFEPFVSEKAVDKKLARGDIGRGCAFHVVETQSTYCLYCQKGLELFTKLGYSGQIS